MYLRTRKNRRRRRRSAYNGGTLKAVKKSGKKDSDLIHQLIGNLKNNSSVGKKENINFENKGNTFSLSSVERTNFEKKYSCDFSSVKICSNNFSQSITDKYNTEALTYSNTIYFNPKFYKPDSLKYQIILDHELAHIKQQKRNYETPRIMRWDDKGHYNLTISGIRKFFSGLGIKFKSSMTKILGKLSAAMDYKIPELKFNAGGLIISKFPFLSKKQKISALQTHYLVNLNNARNHGEGGCYLFGYSKARTQNIFQENKNLFAANTLSKMKTPFPALNFLGDALHISQDRGAHGEGARNNGHALQILKPGYNPDDKSKNSSGWKKAETNTLNILQNARSTVIKYLKK